MRAIALYTGGKDSHYALMKALEEGIEVVGLVTALPKSIESWMFHAVNIKWTELHAKAMGIKQYFIEVSGVKEREVDEFTEGLKKLMRDVGFDCLIVGAVTSKYQYDRVMAMAKKLGADVYAPLWGRDPYEVLNEEIGKIKFILIAIQAYGLTEKWLGKVISEENKNEFINICRKYYLSPVGEGGEFETFVIYSPLFGDREVKIVRYEKVWYSTQYVGYIVIKEAKLELLTS